MQRLLPSAVTGGVVLLLTTIALAHDGVPLTHQPMCCVNECVPVDDYAEQVDAYTYRLVKSGLTAPPGRTFHSTNGKTIVCPYENGGIRCLFIPKPHVS